MKQGIHPDYKEATVTCGCGNTFKTGSVKEDLRVDRLLQMPSVLHWSTTCSSSSWSY